ncbi:DUF6153 family protein [Streptomyces sp. NPDC048442]|uniref:DUF6153 family protein n=1 Tax=Streptomyces sp. NPDC048442 TaxID=3154823 RepID=UPI00342C502A
MSTSVGGAWGGRLLLFAALLLGIVTMHTLGHPSGEHGGRDTGSVSISAPMTAPHALHTAPGTTASDPTPALSSPQGPLHGMDPMSVCLAVLTAWGVALLGARLLTSRPFAWAAPPGGGVLLRALWPRPPPRKAVLARLSVLRI